MISFFDYKQVIVDEQINKQKNDANAQMDYNEQSNIEVPHNVTKLLELVDKHKISTDTINKWLDKASVASIHELDEDKIESILKFINDKY